MKTILVVTLLAMVSCSKPVAPPAPVTITATSAIEVENRTAEPTKVSVAFGANSVVLPAAWKAFCTETAKLNCSFDLAAHATQSLPTGGSYLNATLAFDDKVGCGSTKAELNVNNPKWYDIVDISLVDGFSSGLSIDVLDPEAGKAMLGPVVSKTGNEKAFGVYPLGCDICVARQKPSCGMAPGKDGCKTGAQNNPDVPCQWQGTVMGGGATTIRIARL
jgi:hypothetical protein